MRIGIFFVREQVADCIADDIISDILDAVDLDAVVDDFGVRVERLERSLQALGRSDDVMANLDHHRRDRLDVINHHSVRRFFDRVDNIIQMCGKRMNVFGIERRDERLIQPTENVMNDFVSFALQDGDLFRRLREVSVACFDTLLAAEWLLR